MTLDEFKRDAKPTISADQRAKHNEKYLMQFGMGETNLKYSLTIAEGEEFENEASIYDLLIESGFYLITIDSKETRTLTFININDMDTINISMAFSTPENGKIVYIEIDAQEELHIYSTSQGALNWNEIFSDSYDLKINFYKIF